VKRKKARKKKEEKEEEEEEEESISNDLIYSVHNSFHHLHHLKNPSLLIRFHHRKIRFVYQGLHHVLQQLARPAVLRKELAC
jgi:hypothetical protein